MKTISKKTLSISFLLHAQAYKETSLILRLFSKEFGRFSVIAKGVKRKQNQALRAILQPFVLLEIEIVGRGEIKTLCNAQALSRVALPNRALACGYYMNELIMRSTQEWQELSPLFLEYEEAIYGLSQEDSLSITENDSTTKYSAVLRKFEVRLLDELGIAPQWFLDTNEQTIQPNSYYQYINEHGFSKIKEKVNSSFSGSSILALGNGKFSKKDLKESQKLTQQMLREVIGNRPLESRKLWL